MNKILAYLRQPSTYAGIGVVCATIGQAFPGSPTIQAITAAVSAVGGCAAVLLNEGGGNAT